MLKQTDLKKDQVLLRGEGFGGSALYGEKDFANIKMFNDVIEASGLGNFSHTELEKALAGKIASASLSMNPNRVYVNGSSTPKDVETMLQLAYLYFSNIAKDQKSYDNLMQTAEINLKNRLLQPEAVLQDSLTATLTCNNPRNKAMTAENLALVDYDRILEMAKEQTANAAAFTFTIIGNYDEEAIRPLIETYLASLPAQKEVVKSPNVATEFKGVVINNFKHKGETPKAYAVMEWYTKDIPLTAENDVKIDMISQILDMEYLKKIREEASAAYTVQSLSGIDRNDFETTAQILAICPMKPEKADTAIMILRDEVDALTKTCDADKLQKVKEYMLKSHGDQLKQNGYWLSVINLWRKWGIDFHTDYEKLVNAQTPESISAIAAEILKAGNRAEVIMLPAE